MNRPVLVVTHGGVGAEMVALARALLGDFDGLESISLSQADSLDTLSAKMQKWAARLDPKTRGIILTDLKNSSATVCALALAKKYPVDCLCGLNLPMLLKSLSPSAPTLSDIVNAGRDGIDKVGRSK